MASDRGPDGGPVSAPNVGTAWSFPSGHDAVSYKLRPCRRAACATAGVLWRRVAPSPVWRTPISTPVALFAVVLLVLANGFFVATEFSLVAVRRTRMQQLAAEGSSRARSVIGLLDHLDTYIAATQLGITISSIGLGWIGEPAVARLIAPGIEQLTFLPESWRHGATHTIAFIIAFSIITTLHIVFGELAPKSLALQRSEATSLWVAVPIRAFELVFRPIIFALNGIGNAVVRLFGIQPAAGHTLVQSAEELKLAIDASREAGLVEESAHDLVDRAFLFSDLDVRHAMVPRTEVTAVPVDASLMEIFQIAAETSHTRLPVYERDNDHIVGIVNIKRLLPLLYEKTSQAVPGAANSGVDSNGADPFAGFDVRAYMNEVFAVPETVPAPDVLARMREERVQLAVVVDEYGGTAGIVTLEDLVESLVGEIEDEDQAEEEPERGDGTLVLDGLTTLVEAKEYHGLDLEETLDVETVGGWVFGVLGRPAVVGDEVTAPDGRILRVEELDGLRIARVRVLPARERQEPDDAAREPVGVDASGADPAAG